MVWWAQHAAALNTAQPGLPWSAGLAQTERAQPQLPLSQAQASAQEVQRSGMLRHGIFFGPEEGRLPGQSSSCQAHDWAGEATALQSGAAHRLTRPHAHSSTIGTSQGKLPQPALIAPRKQRLLIIHSCLLLQLFTSLMGLPGPKTDSKVNE